MKGYAIGILNDVDMGAAIAGRRPPCDGRARRRRGASRAALTVDSRLRTYPGWDRALRRSGT
jgi:hypothetical protein